jgi:hypothetical protein
MKQDLAAFLDQIEDSCNSLSGKVRKIVQYGELSYVSFQSVPDPPKSAKSIENALCQILAICRTLRFVAKRAAAGAVV